MFENKHFSFFIFFSSKKRYLQKLDFYTEPYPRNNHAKEVFD